MSRPLDRLNVLAIWLLGGVLAPVLLAQNQSGTRSLTRVEQEEQEWVWPAPLEVYPAHPGDPVKLVRTMKDGKELVPGTYGIPQIAGTDDEDVDAVKEWLHDASFILKSQTSKNIVSVGISIRFPGRSTDVACFYITGDKTEPSPWCNAHSHWCDGGCPALIHNELHWGLIPAMTASGLEDRYARARARGENWRILRQGKDPLRLAPGEEIALSPDGRDEGTWGFTDPRHGVTDSMNGIVGREGIDDARDTEPCEERANSKTGCAFAEVSKFNIGVDVVYFEDGTIWGNYGYGYALPNPDGIFTRVDAQHFPGLVSPVPAAN